MKTFIDILLEINPSLLFINIFMLGWLLCLIVDNIIFNIKRKIAYRKYCIQHELDNIINAGIIEKINKEYNNFEEEYKKMRESYINDLKESDYIFPVITIRRSS